MVRQVFAPCAHAPGTGGDEVGLEGGADAIEFGDTAGSIGAGGAALVAETTHVVFAASGGVAEVAKAGNVDAVGAASLVVNGRGNRRSGLTHPP